MSNETDVPIETNESSTDETQSPDGSITLSLGYRILLGVIIVALPILGFWSGYNFAIDNREANSDTEPNLITVNEQIEAVSETGSTQHDMDSTNEGEIQSLPIESGPVVDLAKDDFVSTGSGFWATPYFAYDGKIYYELTPTTSKELIGVDVETFKKFGDKYGSNPFVYVMRGYMIDRHGIICDDKRLVGVDIETFDQILEPGSSDRYTAYAKDKNNVYLPASYSPQSYYGDEDASCSILDDADPETFEILEAHPFYAKDKDSVYLYDEVITGANPETFTLLSDGFAFDEESVYLENSKVGQVEESVPNEFTGLMQVSKLNEDYSTGYLLFSNDVSTNVLRTFQIHTGWNYRGYVANEGDSIYFLNKQGEFAGMNLESGEYRAFDLKIDISENSYGYEEVKLNSFLVLKNMVYLLKGDNCNEYLARCNLSLYSYNMDTNEERLLATGLTTRGIRGFNSEKNKLYFSYGGGDAGCFWGSYEAFSLDSMTMEKVGGVSGCGEDDVEYSGLIEEVKWIESNLDSLQGGRLVKSLEI